MEVKYFMESTSSRFDGWINLMTGLGVRGKDKSTHGTVISRVLSQEYAEDLYSGDDISRKIVDRLPYDGMRKFIEFENLDSKTKMSMNEYSNKLGLRAKVKEAWVQSRLYGGSAIFMNFSETSKNGSDLSYLETPVNERSILDIKSLVVLNRYELQPSVNIISDITSPMFGMPESYRVTPQSGGASGTINAIIHHTRLIRFEGAYLPTRKFVENQYWHDSVLSSIFQVISSYNQSYQSASSTLADFRISIIKLKNLFEMVASGNEELVKKRMELLNLQKSVLSMVLLNEGEDFEQKIHSLSGIKDVLDKIDQRLIAASGYPHTILLGESPSGLGATGNSEIRDYYDTVSQQQEYVLRSPLEKLFNYIFLCKNGPSRGVFPEGANFKFCNLWQITDTERAKMELDVAKKDEIYISNQVLTPDEVTKSRFGGSDFSQDTRLINE